MNLLLVQAFSSSIDGIRLTVQQASSSSAYPSHKLLFFLGTWGVTADHKTLSSSAQETYLPLIQDCLHIWFQGAHPSRAQACSI
jgi:hypothetical protein